jgi:hypothetical protein
MINSSTTLVATNTAAFLTKYKASDGQLEWAILISSSSPKTTSGISVCSTCLVVPRQSNRNFPADFEVNTTDIKEPAMSENRCDYYKIQLLLLFSSAVNGNIIQLDMV